MSNKAPKRPKPEKPKLRLRHKKEPLSLWQTVLALATLIGVPAAVVTFWPRVTATISDPVDTNDPFSSSITITNAGYLPLKAVTANFSVGKIVFKGPKGPTTLLGNEADSEWHWKDWAPHDLGIDDRFTVTLNDPLNISSVTSAEVAVVVTYELPGIHIRRKKLFPMFAKRQTNGNFYWYSDTFAPK